MIDVADPIARCEALAIVLKNHPEFKSKKNIREMIDENDQQKRIQSFQDYYVLTILRLGPEHFPLDQVRRTGSPVEMKHAHAIDAEVFLTFVREVILPNERDTRMENFEGYSRQKIEQIYLVLEMVIHEDDPTKRIKAYIVHVLQIPENTHGLDGLVDVISTLSTSYPASYITASQMVMNSPTIRKMTLGDFTKKYFLKSKLASAKLILSSENWDKLRDVLSNLPIEQSVQLLGNQAENITHEKGKSTTAETPKVIDSPEQLAKFIASVIHQRTLRSRLEALLTHNLQGESFPLAILVHENEATRIDGLFRHVFRTQYGIPINTEPFKAATSYLSALTRDLIKKTTYRLLLTDKSVKIGTLFKSEKNRKKIIALLVTETLVDVIENYILFPTKALRLPAHYSLECIGINIKTMTLEYREEPTKLRHAFYIEFLTQYSGNVQKHGGLEQLALLLSHLLIRGHEDKIGISSVAHFVVHRLLDWERISNEYKNNTVHIAQGTDIFTNAAALTIFFDSVIEPEALERRTAGILKFGKVIETVGIPRRMLDGEEKVYRYSELCGLYIATFPNPVNTDSKDEKEKEREKQKETNKKRAERRTSNLLSLVKGRGVFSGYTTENLARTLLGTL